MKNLIKVFLNIMVLVNFRIRSNPQRKRSAAVSETKNSLVPYDVDTEWLAQRGTGAGQENTAVVDENMLDTINENNAVVASDEARPSTTIGDETGDTESGHIETINEMKSIDDSENFEMKTIDTKDDKVGDDAEDLSKSDENSPMPDHEGLQAKSNEPSNEKPNEKSPSIPVYAEPDKSRKSKLIQDSPVDRSARENAYEDVDKSHDDKTPSEPSYAEPDMSRKSKLIQNSPLDRSAREQTYEDVNIKPGEQVDNNLVSPYADSATAAEYNDDAPVYSIPDKRKESQVSTSSISMDGYSKVKIDTPEGPSRPVDAANMYEEVKLGDMEKAPEIRRPTLPDLEGHPLLKHSVKSKTDPIPNGVRSLPAIDENQNVDMALYAEATFNLPQSTTEQATNNGNATEGEQNGATKSDSNEEDNNGNVDQTEWVDNIVYASTDLSESNC